MENTSTTQSWADAVGDEHADQPQMVYTPSKPDETEQITSDEPVLEDKIITCCDCNSEFLFDVGTQQFFIEKKLDDPKRCHWCKMEKKKNHSFHKVEDPHEFFCKICNLKSEMPGFEVAFFKKNNWKLRTKCKKCKKIKKKTEEKKNETEKTD